MQGPLPKEGLCLRGQGVGIPSHLFGGGDNQLHRKNLLIRIVRPAGLDPKDKAEVLGQGYKGQENAEGQHIHRKKDGGQQQGGKGQDDDLRAQQHGAVLHKCRQVPLIEPGAPKPFVQPPGTAGKAEPGNKQEGDGGQHGQGGPYGAQAQEKEGDYKVDKTHAGISFL